MAHPAAALENFEADFVEYFGNQLAILFVVVIALQYSSAGAVTSNRLSYRDVANIAFLAIFVVATTKHILVATLAQVGILLVPLLPLVSCVGYLQSRAQLQTDFSFASRKVPLAKHATDVAAFDASMHTFVDGVVPGHWLQPPDEAKAGKRVYEAVVTARARNQHHRRVMM